MKQLQLEIEFFQDALFAFCTSSTKRIFELSIESLENILDLQDPILTADGKKVVRSKGKILSEVLAEMDKKKYDLLEEAKLATRFQLLCFEEIGDPVEESTENNS